MKIVILGRSDTTYSTRALLESCRTRGVSAEVITPSRCHVHTSKGVLQRGQRLDPPDAVLRRFIVVSRQGTFNKLLQDTIAWQWLLEGALCLNPPAASYVAANKFWALQILHANGIPTPPTVIGLRFIRNPLREVPVVLKGKTGAMGAGVSLHRYWSAARKLIDRRHAEQRPLTIQKYLNGRNLRVVVVGQRVIDVTERTPQTGEFRANIARGASAKAVQLSPDHEQLCVRAMLALQLHYAGIDLIETDDGLYVLEVNPTPGLKPEAPTSPNLADAVIDYVIAQVQKGDRRR